MRALLDVNVLIALFDVDHVHHRVATDWLASHGEIGWASCPLTQNGCLRIMSQPRYPNAWPLPDLIQRLNRATATAQHQFIADDISLLDADHIDQSMLLSPGQLTDVYLLALAVKHKCRFVTFDRAIPTKAVRQFNADNLTIL